jgi:cytochrome b561
MPMDTPPLRYHPLLVVLHWLLAALVVTMLATGMTVLQSLPDTAGRLKVLKLHMAFGALILLLTVARVVVRFWFPRPTRAATGHPALDRAAALVHAALYLLVLATALSGIGTAVVAGLPAIVFGSGAAVLPDLRGLPPRIAHGVLAWSLTVLVVLHVAAALHHQFIRRDGLMRRMSLRGPRSHPPST